jgi:clan AA aspartic protease (TIGR02281 family)
MRSKSLSLILCLVLLSLLPAWAESSFDKGVQAYKAGNYRSALVYFDASFNSGQQSANSLYYEALCWHHLGQPATSKEIYSRIISNYASSPAAQLSKTALQQLGGGNRPTETAATITRMDNSSANPAPPRGFSGQGGWYLPDHKVICEVPFSLDREGMVVPVTVNGKLVPAIWDTGASGMFFTKSQLEKAGVSLASASKAGRAIGIGGEVPVYHLDGKVQIGTEIETLQVMVQDDTAAQRANLGESRFGLIGQDFFGKYAYEVDPESRVIRFLKRTNLSPRRPVVVPRSRLIGANGNLGEAFTWSNGVMVVTAKINGRECDMIFDTGATTIAFSDKQLIGAGLTRPIDSSSATALGVGGKRDAFRFALDSVRFGPVLKSGVPANVSVYGSQAKPLLGQSFLSGIRYIVDAERQIIRMTGN